MLGYFSLGNVFGRCGSIESREVAMRKLKLTLFLSVIALACFGQRPNIDIAADSTHSKLRISAIVDNDDIWSGDLKGSIDCYVNESVITFEVSAEMVDQRLIFTFVNIHPDKQTLCKISGV